MPIVEWGHPGWLSALIDEAVERARSGVTESIPSARRGAVLDAWVRGRLWSTGVVFGNGYGGNEGPVRAEGETDRAFVQTLRFQLAVASSLLSATTLRISDEGAMLAALCAAKAQSFPVAARLDEAARGKSALDTREREHLFSIVGAALHRRAYLDGNPSEGLPLHFILAAIESRAFVRLASGYLLGRGSLPTRSHRHAVWLSRLKAGAVELASSLVRVDGPPGDGERLMARRQVRDLGLKTADRRTALESLDNPRPARELVTVLPRHLRAAAIEQAAILSAQVVPGSSDQESGSPRLKTFRDSLTRAAVALVAAMEEDGEIDGILRRAVRGESLTADERAQARRSLLELAKSIPDLALLQAPGGLLLLPVLFRVALKPGHRTA